MSAYFYELYFSETVTREQLEQAVLQLPEAKVGPEGPDHYWVGNVHLFFDDEDLEPLARQIQERTGMAIGRFSLDVGVHNRTLEGSYRLLDVVLALTQGRDFVALHDSESMRLWQKGDDLQVDTLGLGQATQEYIRARRPCRFQPIGKLLTAAT